MGLGLDIKQKPLEVDQTDWINYKGIYRKYSELKPIEKAWVERWKDEKTNESKKSYDRKNKNRIREEIIKIINNQKRGIDKFHILTLDSSEYLFCNQVNKNRPYYPHKIYLAQNNLEEYKKMAKNKSENIFLHYGDISDYSFLDDNFDVIYLDFCCTFDLSKKIIKSLLKKMNTATYIGFTFCWRKFKKELNDPKYDIIKKIQNITNLNLHMLYAKSYRDKGHAPMTTLFFENKGKYPHNLDKRIRTHMFCRKCGRKYTIEEYKKEHPNMKNISTGWCMRVYCSDCSSADINQRDIVNAAKCNAENKNRVASNSLFNIVATKTQGGK